MASMARRKRSPLGLTRPASALNDKPPRALPGGWVFFERRRFTKQDEDRPNDGCGNAEEPEMIDPVPVFRVLSFTLQFGLIAQQRNQRVRKRPVVALLRHNEGLR